MANNMTLTPEQTQLAVRTLAERVMGWRLETFLPHPLDKFPLVQLTHRHEVVLWTHWGAHGMVFNPTTSRDDMAEVEARLTDQQWGAYITCLSIHHHREHGEYNTEFPDEKWLWWRWLRTASPLICAVCLCRALGVEIG